VQNWNHYAMWYACGLNKLAHFHSSISQNNIVNFINDFWRSNLSIGRLERGASYVNVWQRLNSFTQLYTVANADADVLWTLSNSALISFGVKPFICRCYFDHCTKLVFFHFTKNTKVVRFNRLQKWTRDEFRSKFDSNQLRDVTCQKLMWHDTASALWQIF